MHFRGLQPLWLEGVERPLPRFIEVLKGEVRAMARVSWQSWVWNPDLLAVHMRLLSTLLSVMGPRAPEHGQGNPGEVEGKEAAGSFWVGCSMLVISANLPAAPWGRQVLPHFPKKLLRFKGMKVIRAEPVSELVHCGFGACVLSVPSLPSRAGLNEDCKPGLLGHEWAPPLTVGGFTLWINLIAT